MKLRAITTRVQRLFLQHARRAPRTQARTSGEKRDRIAELVLTARARTAGGAEPTDAEMVALQRSAEWLPLLAELSGKPPPGRTWDFSVNDRDLT